MTSVSPVCQECGEERAAYDYLLIGYFCRWCRDRAESLARLQAKPLPRELDPWPGGADTQTFEATQ